MESNNLLFTLLVTLAVLTGGCTEEEIDNFDADVIVELLPPSGLRSSDYELLYINHRGWTDPGWWLYESYARGWVTDESGILFTVDYIDVELRHHSCGYGVHTEEETNAARVSIDFDHVGLPFGCNSDISVRACVRHDFTDGYSVAGCTN